MAFFGLTALAGLDTEGPFKGNTRSILNVRSKEDWMELFHLFHVYDADGNGMFNMTELKNLLTTYSNREPAKHEVEVLGKYLDQNKNGLITWDEFVDGIRTASEHADGTLVLPVVEYKSAGMYHEDLVRHHRRKTGPQQQYKQPMLSSHQIGWEAGLMTPVGDTRFRHRTTDLSQFNAARDKHIHGRSVGSEFGSLAKSSMRSSGGFGMGY